MPGPIRRPRTILDTATALIMAANEGHVDCARLLMDAGADKEAKNKDGSTALICVAIEGDVDCVRLLLSAAVDTEAEDNHKFTALIAAAASGRTYCTRLLIDAGVDKNAKKDDGSTALICAECAADDGYDCHSHSASAHTYVLDARKHVEVVALHDHWRRLHKGDARELRVGVKDNET